MEQGRSVRSGFSTMGAAALLSIALLIGSIFWKSGEKITATNMYAAAQVSEDADNGYLDAVAAEMMNGSDQEANIFTDIGADIISELNGSYAKLQEDGAYTLESGVSVAENIGMNVRPVVSSREYTASDIRAAQDTSAEGTMAYRRAMQSALAPLMQNSEAEFVLFGQYLDTKNVEHLIELQRIEENYRTAAANLAALSVPSDAVTYHLAILNSLEHFAATLESMVAHADDPFAAAALLTTYNSAEENIAASFDSITVYFKAKQS